VKEQFCGRKGARPEHAQQLTQIKQLSRGLHVYDVNADGDVPNGDHIGAIWRTRLNTSVCSSDVVLCQTTFDNLFKLKLISIGQSCIADSVESVKNSKFL